MRKRQFRILNDSEQRRYDEASNPGTSAERLTELSAVPHLRSAVAGNAATPANLLEHLAQDRDPQVRQAAARNPNTPWTALEQLAWEFPQAFLHNPLAPLQFLVHPEQITTDDAFWGALLREASLPPTWWSWLKSQPVLSKRLVVRLHVQSAGETSFFAGDPQEKANDVVPVLASLLINALQQGRALPTFRLTDVYPSTAFLQWLARSASAPLRCIAAAHPQTPEEVLRSLAQDQDSQVRSLVAENERTPEDVLRMLAQDQAEQVRRSAVENVRIPEDVLRTLVQVRDYWVLRAVAMNERLPEDTLEILVQDPTDWVLSAVATRVKRRQLSEKLLRTLASHTAGVLRRAVARNKWTPEDILRTMASKPDRRERRAVAEREQLSEEFWQILVRDPDLEVRRMLAGHWPIPEEALQTLAQDQSKWVRRAVALNAQVPAAFLQTLAQDAEQEVQRCASSALRLLNERSRLQLWEQMEQWTRDCEILLNEVFGPHKLLNLPPEEQLKRISRLDIGCPPLLCRSSRSPPIRRCVIW